MQNTGKQNAGQEGQLTDLDRFEIVVRVPEDNVKWDPPITPTSLGHSQAGQK